MHLRQIVTTVGNARRESIDLDGNVMAFSRSTEVDKECEPKFKNEDRCQWVINIS